MMQPASGSGYTQFSDVDPGLSADVSSNFYNQPNEGAQFGQQPQDQPFQQNQPQKSKYRHPVAVFFHFFFKVSAIAMYLIGSLIIKQFVIMFIVVTMLAAFDFWTVKNVSGRLMAGMRWWNEVTPDGTNKWIFESVADRDSVDSGESMTFWISLFVTPAVWILFFLSTLLPPNIPNMVVVLVGLSLTIANVVGYLKCRKDAKSKVQGAASNFVFGQLFKQNNNNQNKV